MGVLRPHKLRVLNVRYKKEEMTRIDILVFLVFNVKRKGM